MNKIKINHISDMESHLGFWLRFVSNHVSSRFKKSLEANDVSISEWVVMRYLYDDEVISSFELIDALGMTKGAISKILTRLQNKKWVKRVTLNEDKRTQKIMLTASGRQLVPKLAALADQNEALFFGHLTERQYKELINIMKHIITLHSLKKIPVD